MNVSSLYDESPGNVYYTYINQYRKMKKSILFVNLTLILVSCGTIKTNVSDTYIREVTSYYQFELPPFSEDYSVFWDYIVENNKAFKSYNNINSNFKNKTIKQFNKDLNSISSYLSGYDVEDNRDNYIVGSKYKEKIKKISFLPSSDIDAFCYPNGYIFITNGMIKLFGLGMDEYFGVVAHEIAHIMFKHAEREFFTTKKKERRNSIISGISAVSLAAGASIAIINSAQYMQNNEDIEKLTRNYVESALITSQAIDHLLVENSYYKKFEYSREMEIEADIVAILFLNWLGKSPESYIRLLSKLPNHTPTLSDSHPDIRYRVKFLSDYIGKPNKTFKVDGRIYHIDGLDVEKFILKNPTAVERFTGD
ncbi:MAG: M48 family metalloprotease [Clostridia bacterium]|nr:M48 family metalloprotease [Clostridia bacterium]